MDDDTTLLAELRAAASALRDAGDATAGRGLSRVLGWAAQIESHEGWPCTDDRVRTLVDRAVQELTDEADLYAAAGDDVRADVARRDARALAAFRTRHDDA